VRPLLRILGIVSPAVTALLALLAVAGAILGAERVRVLAGSLPALALSAAAVLLLALWTGVLVSRRRPGAALACAGAGLVLAGGLWGSDYAHALRKAAVGDTRIASGLVPLPKGRAVREAVDRDFSRRLGQLPFELRLNSFQTDYYEPAGRPWRLMLLTADEQGRASAREVHWQWGRSVAIPSSNVELQVSDYLPHAVPLLAEGDEPRLEVRGGGRQLAALPARRGEEVSLPQEGIALRVVADPEPGESGYVKVEVSTEGRTPEILFVPAGDRVPLGRDDLVVGYTLPTPAGAAAGGESDGPAMQYTLRAGATSVGGWLFAGSQRSAQLAGARLAWVRGNPGEGAPLLQLAPPVRHVRQYLADVSVIRDGSEVTRETVRVNHPLHYGGYDLCLSEHDARGGDWVLMSFRSDAGLGLVFAGMALVVCGAVWACWVGPAVLSAGREEESDGD
jgi:hypothetical protein